MKITSMTIQQRPRPQYNPLKLESVLVIPVSFLCSLNGVKKSKMQ